MGACEQEIARAAAPCAALLRQLVDIPQSVGLMRSRPTSSAWTAGRGVVFETFDQPIFDPLRALRSGRRAAALVQAANAAAERFAATTGCPIEPIPGGHSPIKLGHGPRVGVDLAYSWAAAAGHQVLLAIEDGWWAGFFAMKWLDAQALPNCERGRRVRAIVAAFAHTLADGQVATAAFADGDGSAQERLDVSHRWREAADQCPTPPLPFDPTAPFLLGDNAQYTLTLQRLGGAVALYARAPWNGIRFIIGALNLDPTHFPPPRGSVVY